ncbi:MAG TPA: hydrogenase maturation protease [bacterium]|nr:hydrogenase maturation protease [bacterium]
MNKKPAVIIGVGNYLMGDEGVGVHAIAALQEVNLPGEVELIDAGTPGISLVHMIDGRRLAVIIDCADFGGKPGEIKSFDPETLKRDENAEISLHATDLLSALALAKSTGNYPKRVMILGIQPKGIEMGIRLSSEVESALPLLPDLIRDIIGD